jgi:hypothetical protein
MLARLFAALGFALVPVAAFAAGLTVSPQKIERAAPAYQLTVAYPRTGNATIDDAIVAWAKHEADEFVSYTGEARLDEGTPWSLNVTYKVARNDGVVFAVVFKAAMNDDGNHTHFAFTTFNYAMPGARRLTLGDVVLPEAFAKMRAYALAHMVSESPDFGAEVAEDVGLSPVEATFAAFTLARDSITVYFTPEQLGNMTSAGGHATIPFGELSGLLRARP